MGKSSIELTLKQLIDLGIINLKKRRRKKKQKRVKTLLPKFQKRKDNPLKEDVFSPYKSPSGHMKAYSTPNYLPTLQPNTEALRLRDDNANLNTRLLEQKYATDDFITRSENAFDYVMEKINAKPKLGYILYDDNDVGTTFGSDSFRPMQDIEPDTAVIQPASLPSVPFDDIHPPSYDTPIEVSRQLPLRQKDVSPLPSPFLTPTSSSKSASKSASKSSSKSASKSAAKAASAISSSITNFFAPKPPLSQSKTAFEQDPSIDQFTEAEEETFGGVVKGAVEDIPIQKAPVKKRAPRRVDRRTSYGAADSDDDTESEAERKDNEDFFDVQDADFTPEKTKLVQKQGIVLPEYILKEASPQVEYRHVTENGRQRVGKTELYEWEKWYRDLAGSNFKSFQPSRPAYKRAITGILKTQYRQNGGAKESILKSDDPNLISRELALIRQYQQKQREENMQGLNAILKKK